MKKLDIMYVVNPDLNTEAINSITQKYENIVKNNHGNVIKTDLWGKKRLAYEIQNFQEGTYILMVFEGEPNCIRELDRLIRIDENVLRHMIVSK